MNLIMSSIAIAVAGTAIAVALREPSPPATSSEGGAPAPRPPDPAPARSLPPTVTADVTARCLPAVVNISTRRATRGGTPSGNPFFDLLRPFLGADRSHETRSLGSGVIVDAAGVVLTNHHVVADATEIRVTLSDGREYPAVTVASDPESDVAVLRLQADEGETLALASLAYGDSALLRQGDPVLAIGNPFGVGQTVTMGIVSATGRASMGITDYEDFIQTDAAINPGNSGGALVNLEGELVGINTAILSRTGGSHGIGFAIPSNMAQPIAAALQRDGRVTRGWLGVALQDLSRQLARSMGIQGSLQGAVVMDVEASGPAAGVDLLRGDLVTQLDSEPIRSGRQLRNLVATRGAGAVVQITRRRAGQAAELRVTLAERPRPPAGQPPPADETRGAREVAGLTLAPLTDALRARYAIGAGVRGALVVATGSGPGPAAGIQVADVIEQVGGQPVDSPESFQRHYEGSFFVAMVQIRRGGESRVLFVGR